MFDDFFGVFQEIYYGYFHILARYVQKKIWTPCILHNLGQAVISHCIQKLPHCHNHILQLPNDLFTFHDLKLEAVKFGRQKNAWIFFRMLYLEISIWSSKKSRSAPISSKGLTNPQVVSSGSRPARSGCARVRGINCPKKDQTSDQPLYKILSRELLSKSKDGLKAQISCNRFFVRFFAQLSS